MKKLTLFICIFILLPLCYSELDEHISEMKSKLKREVENLNDIRILVNNERESLLEKFSAEEKKLLNFRTSISNLDLKTSASKEEYEQLEEEVNHLKDEVEYLWGNLKDLRRNFSMLISESEEKMIHEELMNIDDIFNNNQKELTPDLLNLISNLYMNKIDRSFSRDIYSGYCLDKKGIQKKGRFFSAGPLKYFLSDDNNTAGLTGFNNDQARLRIEKDIPSSELRKIFEKQQALLPVDITLGNAEITASLNNSFIGHIKKGGVIIYPILFLGLICIIVIIFKSLTLLRIYKLNPEDLAEIVNDIKNGDSLSAKTAILKLDRPYAPVLMEGFFHADNPKEHLEDLMHEKVLTEIPFLEKWLSVLAVSAAASPLLGLLGTVTGMIHTFDLITIFGTGKADLLSSGISEALITTEFGLIIAIPSLIFHAFFTRRVKHIIHSLDAVSLSFINSIKDNMK